MITRLGGTDDGLVAIGARFGIGAAVGAGLGEGAAGAAADAAGYVRPARKRPIYPFNLPPGLLAVTTVGAYLDVPHQFGPRTSYYWDVTSITIEGFTAGQVNVSKNAPAVTAAGNPYAVENVAQFLNQGTQNMPMRGQPLLDATERLVFTVVSAITGYAQIGGTVVMIPAERIDEYLA